MKKNFDLTMDDFKVVDGKVVINSEELANAILDEQVNVSEEEGSEGIVIFGQCFCGGNKVKE